MSKIYGLLILAISLFSCQSSPDSSKHKDHSHGDAATTSKTIAPELVANENDLVCNMSLKSGIKDTAQFEGKTYGFCSEQCREDFKKNPQQFAKK